MSDSSDGRQGIQNPRISLGSIINNGNCILRTHSDNEKSFIIDDCDMLVALIVCGVLLLMGVALTGFVGWGLWHILSLLRS
jgi:hypothetical protein